MHVDVLVMAMVATEIIFFWQYKIIILHLCAIVIICAVF
jgi:hypothetical protein